MILFILINYNLLYYNKFYSILLLSISANIYFIPINSNLGYILL